MNSERLSPVQRQTLIRLANAFGTDADIAALRKLPSNVKREIKIWLGRLVINEGLAGDEISEAGREIDDLIDLIGF